ncbi:MAG: cytidylate kinase-like family protein [Ignavibacteriota bacterium]|jgi:cytidylate kinase|nr:MAG: cytidylate kinase-like family protein [Chlorobiota bacterium]MBE7476415.1 cytidylate kinase-like family protein [Ignavibacteriales bacterium]MBL1124397.1 cytidylate kinase-like family protein [Ignavibacteriota bacterium]MCC7092670.1 cytidylate kinase-like family protein [Ignavibacteriaceae bacterium]MCE7857624.1 cytidylate kinase-like family protein [Ignavibacteria bacterium CHB3]
MAIGVYEKSKRYIESNTQKPDQQKHKKGVYPCITISRQTGAGSKVVCEKLIEIMDNYSEFEGVKWAYFDQNLIERVLEDHHLPQQISEYMKEEKFKNIDAVVYEMLGLKPSEWTIVHKTTETILQLARMGNVVIVGRGAPFITAKLKNAFHVRLIASLEKRVEHIKTLMNLNEKEALAHIKKEDEDRKKYLKSYFHVDVDDPLLYHLTINTELLTHDAAAHLIAEAVVQKFPDLFPQFAH